jgi:hypothetical protein
MPEPWLTIITVDNAAPILCKIMATIASRISRAHYFRRIFAEVKANIQRITLKQNICRNFHFDNPN